MTAKKSAGSAWINLLVDYGPLLVFFLAYRHFTPKGGDAGLSAVVGVTKSTIWFMGATVVALVISKWRLGRISPMLWLSSALIIAFGTLTVFLGDPTWIQIKPTVIYVVFAAILFVGLRFRRPMLRDLLQSVGLDRLRMQRVSGFADRVPAVTNPTAIRNNRIEVILLRDGK